MLVIYWPKHKLRFWYVEWQYVETMVGDETMGDPSIVFRASVPRTRIVPSPGNYKGKFLLKEKGSRWCLNLKGTALIRGRSKGCRGKFWVEKNARTTPMRELWTRQRYGVSITKETWRRVIHVNKAPGLKESSYSCLTERKV